MHTKKAEYFKLIENFINDYQESNGITPTIREIESGLGIPKTTVGRYLAYMREQGMLWWSGLILHHRYHSLCAGVPSVG